MSIPNWIRERPGLIHEYGLHEATSRTVKDLSAYVLRKMEWLDPRGTPIYEKEWDVLILLDGCRVDLMKEVVSEYDFVPDDFQTIRSEASTSSIWMNRNFIDKFKNEMRNTIYITGNPFSEDHIQSDQFQMVDEVWRYGWDDQLGTIPPRHITDRAIAAGRNSQFKRMIVHYMQPHFPSIPDPLNSSLELENFGEDWDSVWKRLGEDQIDYESVWDSYQANLEYVMEEVELLLRNLDADKAVVSSDHGNAFDEWNLYGHPRYYPINILREVPWIEVSGTDNGEYNPDFRQQVIGENSQDVTSRLEHLGYV